MSPELPKFPTAIVSEIEHCMLKTVNEITYYSSPNLEAFPGLVHAFLGRAGGVRAGHLASLNMGRREEDSSENLKENRKRVVEAFGIDEDKIFTVSQVHGNRIVVIDNPDTSPDKIKALEADGIITNIKGVAIGILTADCVSVVLYDHKNKVVAAVHAGWKGTALRIAKNAVEAMMERYGSRPEDMAAAIGPSIGPCCYKVNDDVVVAVGDIDKVARACERHWCLDLPKANLLQLEEAGVKDIALSGICTSCRTDLFFSHRREDGRTGRQLSFISMLHIQNQPALLSL